MNPAMPNLQPISRTTPQQWGEALYGMSQPNEFGTDLHSLLRYLAGTKASTISHANGRTLLDHLIGTMEVLKAWSAPLYLQQAGLFHSIYSTEIFTTAILDASKRDGLRFLLGKKAERLVYLFSVISRSALLSIVEQDVTPPEGWILPAHRDSGEKVVLEYGEIHDLLLLIAANEVEQVYASDGSPGIWLHQIHGIGRFLERSEQWVPSKFHELGSILSVEEELRAVGLYQRALSLLCSDPSEADHLLTECFSVLSLIGEPLLWRAFLAIRRGDFSAATMLASQGVQYLREWGTAWDKRLTYCEWLWVAQTLMEGEKNFSHAITLLRRIAEVELESKQLTDGMIPSTSSRKQRLQAFLNSFGDLTSEPMKMHYNGLAETIVYDPSAFPIVEALEETYPQIKQEIEELGADLYHSEGEGITEAGSWDVLFFYERGRRNVSNCARCPTIDRILREYDTLRTTAALIYVSRLKGNTTVRSHRGPTNVRVRCHLGIKVPEGDCGLLCGGELLKWHAGKCIVFDDAAEHEVWNRTNEERIVLIVDLWHPDLSFEERRVLFGLHRYAYLAAENLQHYWMVNKNNRAKNNKIKTYD